ncbi:hypothetical protein [Chitinophaga qingshengii]|uniref:Uncharacterized protein n=1 Tax=Chitinophaga qingshengii TaxID=1569794 RepID=A0ABR7TIQ2_9BACT|nr:hypothetical protein [Chitinophaga qingshengii]MBC9929352.1 hypothetical protein [Chitinophaga qingshengii]
MVNKLKKVLCLGAIAVFPLFVAAFLTFRLQDPIPLLFDWWLGAAFMWSAFFYGMISPLFYRKYPFIFRCLCWVGILFLLLGIVSWIYYYLYAPSDEVLFGGGF